LKEIEHTAYDDPNKKLLYAHEKGDETILEQSGADQIAGKDDQVFEVREEPADGEGIGAQALVADYANTVRQHWGMFVSSNLVVIEDVDKFRYDVKDNRRLQQVAVHRVFRKTGRFIFQLGIVNFLEQVIINLFLVIHVFNREQQIYAEAAN